MWNLIKIYYYVLFQPEEISNHINEIQHKYFIINRLIISFLISGSFFLLKEKHTYFNLFIFIIIIMILYFIISIVSLIISSLFYKEMSQLLQRYSDEPLNKITKLIQDIQNILELGWLPLIFLVHFSIISYYFNSKLFFLLGFILLLFWKCFIWWKGIQYHLEWDSKFSIKVLLKNIMFIFAIPILHFVLIIILIYMFTDFM
ncbi:MAG: hypothetical protein KatS3mg129_0922 [Leptospiraceae bacterium]|nr:MAG: hypothetical protein KatS3mg129_0922 [Leptospiraceae bacterium]